MENQAPTPIPNQPNDPLNGDHSAKKWWSIMWSNHYIQLCILAIAFIIALFIDINYFDSIWSFVLMLAIPIGMIILIVCLGFIRFWNQLKGGK